MRWPRRDTLIPLALGALAFAVALLQRPGLMVAETKVDLHVAPRSFLHDVLSAWTPTGSLGLNVVSSHVSHEPHGVGPPAQFLAVPARLARPLVILPDFGSNTMVVVPPPAPGS